MIDIFNHPNVKKLSDFNNNINDYIAYHQKLALSLLC